MAETYKFVKYPKMTSEQSKQFNEQNNYTIKEQNKENKHTFVEYPISDPSKLLKALHPDKGGKRRRKTTQKRRKRKGGKSKRRRRM